MPDLRTELERLQEADEHIAIAERGIRRLEAVVARQHQAGFPDDEAHRALHAARESLLAFERHRNLIVAVIEDVKAGRLPGG